MSQADLLLWSLESKENVEVEAGYFAQTQLATPHAYNPQFPDRH